jgi:hypothetical protein
MNDESSRYITVFQQTKETENGQPGDRFIDHGEVLDRRYKVDEETEGFIPVAEPLAVIDAGAEIEKDDLGDWCNSHAGKAVLKRFFPSIEPDDPTLPDTDHLLAEADDD